MKKAYPINIQTMQKGISIWYPKYAISHEISFKNMRFDPFMQSQSVRKSGLGKLTGSAIGSRKK